MVASVCQLVSSEVEPDKLTTQTTTPALTSSTDAGVSQVARSLSGGGTFILSPPAASRTLPTHRQLLDRSILVDEYCDIIDPAFKIHYIDQFHDDRPELLALIRAAWIVRNQLRQEAGR